MAGFSRPVLRDNAGQGDPGDISAGDATGVSRHVEILSGTHGVQGAVCDGGCLGTADSGLDVQKRSGCAVSRGDLCVEPPDDRGVCRERAQRCVGAAGNCVRAGGGTKTAGVGNRAGDVGVDGQSVSGGTATGLDSESGLARKTRGLVGCGIGGRDGTAGGGAILECAGNAAYNDGVLRGDLEELQRESVHPDRLGDRRNDENSGADGRAGQLGTGAVAGVEKRGTGARGVSSDWNDTGVWAEWIFVVLHVDRAAIVFLSESGVADGDGAAVSVVQRADWLRGSGGVQV